VRATPISRWKPASNSESIYSECNGDSTSAFFSDPEHTENETHDERLSRFIAFFNNGPLMRCLDTEDDRAMDVFYERLLAEVREQNPTKNGFRGVLEVTSFWEDIRRQLKLDEEDWCQWPEGYPTPMEIENPAKKLEFLVKNGGEDEDDLDDYLSTRWTIFRRQNINKVTKWLSHLDMNSKEFDKIKRVGLDQRCKEVINFQPRANNPPAPNHT